MKPGKVPCGSFGCIITKNNKEKIKIGIKYLGIREAEVNVEFTTILGFKVCQ